MATGWRLPALGMVIGLSFMAATMALGQTAASPKSANAPSPAAGDEQSQPDRGWHRHHHGWGFGSLERKQICTERYAREAGFLTYLGAKLDLTAQQQPLWDKYHQAMLDSFGKLREVCVANKSSPRWDLTALQLRDRMEKSLTAKLNALHATRPALEALYQSLSPEQREVLDHPRGRRQRH